MFTCLVFFSFLLTTAWSRLVVDSKEQLMVRDGDGRKTLDLMRIIKEGEKKKTDLQESDCPGVMDETAEYEYFTMEGIKERRHSIEITRRLDDVIEKTVFNALEPWVIGHVRIR